jgi:hypothetical protein
VLDAPDILHEELAGEKGRAALESAANKIESAAGKLLSFAERLRDQGSHCTRASNEGEESSSSRTAGAATPVAGSKDVE